MFVAVDDRDALGPRNGRKLLGVDARALTGVVPPTRHVASRCKVEVAHLAEIVDAAVRCDAGDVVAKNARVYRNSAARVDRAERVPHVEEEDMGFGGLEDGISGLRVGGTQSARRVEVGDEFRRARVDGLAPLSGQADAQRTQPRQIRRVVRSRRDDRALALIALLESRKLGR